MTNPPAVPDGAPERARPESFRGRSLQASFTVNDLSKSLTWYRDVVGFTVTDEYRRDDTLFGVALIAGNVRVLLTQDDGAKGWDRAKGEGISLMITTVQDVDELAARIQESGWALELPPTDLPWGQRAFRVVDPDGFKLAIGTPRPDRDPD